MTDSLIERKRQFLVPSVSTYYQQPLIMDHGRGCYLYDVDGVEYLDFFGGILTVSVGHANATVNAAVCDQLSKMSHVSTLYVNEPMVELAERLAKLTPGDLQMSFFTSSGTEANETAIAMARIATGHHEIVALRHSYSGRSALAMSLTGQSNWRMGLAGVPGIVHARNPYYFRSQTHLSEEEFAKECAKDLEETILTATSGRIAAVIVEPIQGVGGFITPPDLYFAEIAEIAHKYGGLLIADEVQTGFGRTGKWFGIEHSGVKPDLMTFAKGMANGIPIGATIATKEVGEKYTGATISTFGGNPVTMRAALATLDVIESENLVGNALVQGNRLRNGLEVLQKKYPIIGDVRGKGLMQAMEFVRGEKEPAADLVNEFFEYTKEERLLIGKGGLYSNAVRIAPPLIVQAEQVEDALERLDRALAKVYERHPEL
ncbi:aspartate aminotransferase family protein [Sulfoacidibacillus thermotolerans]|uniref:alanine--glyoxylate transaminase n=1 Tax=Sulfoacidibacillus thermotolerans TaxID=1765684 RepID=A0A2U3D970_SULT2|nr:aspartate aminotransferase family protein [Sulfoacidibacillus thermotolerans]PWI57838.1 aspartate aminotransferase family protein [Sulfoacidibacillus thermotolerans]